MDTIPVNRRLLQEIVIRSFAQPNGITEDLAEALSDIVSIVNDNDLLSGTIATDGLIYYDHDDAEEMLNVRDCSRRMVMYADSYDLPWTRWESEDDEEDEE